MAVSTIVTTAGSASANAYVSLAVADQYHLDRPAAGTTWSSASDDEKTAAILWATKLLDSKYEWEGWAADAVQVLAWPRTGLMNRNRTVALSTTAIPTEIQQATAEFARQLLAGDRAGDSDVETQGITRLTAGSVSLSFKDSVYAKVVPDAVVNLIPCDWGHVRGTSSVRMLARA